MQLADKAAAHAFDELIGALRQWRRWIRSAHHTCARRYFGPAADGFAPLTTRELERAERELLDALNAWEAGR